MAPAADRLQDDLVIGCRPHNDQPDIGAEAVDGADHPQGETFPVQANQGQVELLVGKELRELKDNELDPGVVLKERDKTLHADGLRLKQCHTQTGR